MTSTPTSALRRGGGRHRAERAIFGSGRPARAVCADYWAAAAPADQAAESVDTVPAFTAVRSA